MIPGLFARLVGNAPKRWLIGLSYVALAAILLLFPFFISPEVKEGGAGQGRRFGASVKVGPAEVRTMPR